MTTPNSSNMKDFQPQDLSRAHGDGMRVPGQQIAEENSAPTNPPTAPKHHGCIHTFSSWFAEIFCCIVGILALIGDIIILWRANNQPPTKIIHHVTVNSLIEFITSVAKFAFMVPIVSVLGQLKWLWFKDEARLLTDFQLYESATGGLGSVKFLKMLFKSPIAWVAAAVALSVLFTSPLTQQAIGYESVRQAQSNGTASVLRASTFSRTDATGFTRLQGDELLVQSAYLTAAYLGPNQTVPGVDPICSSGDCDWPIYGSLAICAEVVNISASTNSSLRSYLLAVFLAELKSSQYGTVFLQAASGGPYYVAAHIPFPEPALSEFKEAPPQTMISQSFVSYYKSPLNISDNADLAKLQFLGVSLYFCTQSLSTTVKGGIQNTSMIAYTNTILSSSTTQTMNSVWNSYLFARPPCGAKITLSGPTGLSNESYPIDFCTAVYLSDVYVIGTSGGILLDLDRSVTDTVGQISQALGIALYGEFNSTGIPDPATQYSNVKVMMENIGKTLTTFMRNEAPTFLSQDNSTIVGTVYAPQTLIHIRWPYLSLLVIQLCLTIIVLFLTIIATYRSRIQILKASTLATICALGPRVKRKLGGVDDMKKLEREAKNTRLRLDIGANGEVKALDLDPTTNNISSPGP